MRKSLGFALTGLCVIACVLDVAWRAVGAMTLMEVSIGSGAFLAVVAFAPLFMKPSDASLNDIGIVKVDEDEADDETPTRATPQVKEFRRAHSRVGQVA